MQKYFTPTSTSPSFFNQLFKLFKKTVNSFRVGVSFLITILAMVFVSGGAWGQTATNGDYRSIATGNWGGATTWQVRSSGSWVATSIAPTSINNVYIQTGHTVTVNTTTVACNDLQLHTSGVLAIGVNIAQVNGKIRAYTGTAVTTAGADGTFYSGQTSSTSPGPSSITTGSGGKLSFVGLTRFITFSGEWGSTLTGGEMEINLPSGNIATPGTNMKAKNWTFTSGTIDCSTTARTISADDGTTGGTISIASGFTYIGAGSPLFQRTGSSSAASLTLSSGGLLQVTPSTSTIAATVLILTGTVEYNRSGTQTLLTAVQSGGTANTYTNLTLSGTSAKTLGVNTTVNGALTITGTASNAYGAFTLGFGSSATATVNTGGSLLLNTGSYGASTNSLILNPNQTVTPALSITSGNTVIWAGTTALSADSRIEANGSTGSLTLSGTATGSGLLLKQAAGTLTFSNASNNLTGGTQIGNGTLIVNSGSSMGTGSLTMFQTSTNNTALTLNNTAQTVSSLSSSFTTTTGTQTQVITLGAGHTLTINQSTNTTYGSGTVSTLTSTLAGSGNLTKSGTGTLTLTSANTYTGTSKISNGKLDLGIANALSSSTNIIIDGGILGTSTGFTQTVGTLNVNVAGSIALGASSHTLTFAASNGETWNGTTLNITGWTGTAGASGTAGKIFIGSNSTGLTSAQLAKISFSGFSGTATILSTGEIVPTAPTPTISGTATATAFTTTYGTASDSQTFSVSGSSLTANLIATAPTGFEVSSDGTTYGSTATFTQSSGSASGSLRIRLAANTAVIGSYDSQNIVLSSTGATAVNIITASSGNSVSAKALTISGISANNKVYDGLTSATLTGTAAYSGLVNSETFSVTGTPTASFATASVGTGKSVTVTGYTAPSSNYTVSQPTGLTANITTAPLTIGGLTADNKVYDGNTTAIFSGTPAYVGLVNGETLSVTGTPTASFTTAAVGTGKTVTVAGYNAPSTNYSLTQPLLTANITAKPLTVTGATAANKIYDGNANAVISGATLVGVINSEDVSVSGNGTFASASVADGISVTTSLVLSGANAANYSLTQPTGLSANITPKPLTITGLTANNKVFDGTTTATLSGTATLNGVVSGDETNVTLTGTPVATFAQSSAGNGIVVTVTGYSLTGSASGNYSVSQPAGLTANITNSPPPVINSVLTATATYGIISTSYFITATNSPTSYGATGLPTGLSINASTGEISGTPTDVAGSPFSVTISATNNGGTGTATLVYAITPKTLTISSPTVPNKVYDRTNAATITGTLTGIVNSDVVSLNGTGTFSQVTVGSNLAVTSTATLNGTDAAKYSLTQPTGLTGEIVVKPLTVSGASVSPKIYDGTNTATLVGGTLGGIVSPDVVTLTGGATFSSVNVANGISINTSSLILGGADAENYIALPIVGLTGNITAKSLTISGLSVGNKVYDGNTTATLTGTATLNGIIGTDDVNISGTPSANFNTKNVGTNKPITITGYTLSGTKSGNYTVSQPSTLTANITLAPLTILNATANNKIYDGNDVAILTGTLSGVVVSETVTLNLSGTFSQVGVGTVLTVTSTSTISGTDASNYSLTQPTGLSANITPKPLTITGLTANNKVFDGTTTATLSGTATLNGVVSGDELNVTLTGTPVATFAQSSAGNGIVVTVTGYSLTGSASTNYSVSQPAGLSANITNSPPPVINSVLTATATYGIVSTSYFITATNSPTSFNATGLPTGLTINTSTGEILGTPTDVAGSPFSVTISATNNGGTGTATLVYAITPKTLTVSSPSVPNKVYDRTNAATITGTLTGIVNSDVVSLNGTGTFSQVNIGSNLAVTSTATLSGTDAAKYSLTQPTGLTGEIVVKPLTITGLTANNKNYDGTTAATLSGVATASLAGIVVGDESNVTLGGTPVANFTQSAVGTAIAVTVVGFTISGTASANYSLAQPTGLTANIVAVPAPVINSVLTASATYGTVAPTYLITATNSPISFNATGLPAGLNINTSTGEITGTPTSITGSPFSVTISATNNGGTGTATLTYTINQKALTITAPLANNKVYDKTNAATIAGTLNGVFGSDVVNLNGTGTFSQVNVGTSLVVTSTSTLSGADASKYTLTQPTGLTANITAKSLTVSGITARNKYFDGTTTTTLSGTATLNGVIAGDVITLGGTAVANFAQSSLGNGIAVTVTGYTITATTNYSLTQPTGLTANIITAPTLTEVILPQYIQGVNGTNSNRIPFAYRASVNGLSPNTAYRYYNGVELTTAALTSVGAGNNIFPSTIQTNNFTYSTGPSLLTAGNYGTFTTDATGAYSGWFIIAPSGNATRFVPGTNLYTRIALVDEAATYVSTVLSSTNTIKVINLVNAAGANNGTGLRGNSGATDKNFVFVYDNTSGTGRPLSGTFVENDGAAEVTSFATFYTSNVDAVSGAYGVVIPNTNANGVRRIEQRDFSTGAIAGCAATDDDGVWSSGVNTVSPTGGATALVITAGDAPLNTCQVINTAPTIAINVASTSNYVDGGVATNILSSYSLSGVINDPTDPAKTLGIDFTIGDAETAVGSLTVTATSSNLTVLPTANLNLTGTGAARNLKITPNAEGFANVTVSVNDGTTTTSFIINYASSNASINTSATRFHTGTSDASTAQVIDNNLMIVGDDENQALRLYNRQNSGLPVNSFDFTTSFGLTDASGGVLREVDIEASAKVGNRIYWMGSHSNASSGNARPNRSRFFATDIAGTGNATTLSYVGRYDNLKSELLTWDASNGHGLGANFLGLSASSATGKIPETGDGSGFNIEGFEIAPNNTTAYICFRAPLQTTTTRTKALIIPLTNFANLVSGNPTSTTATFGNPIQLDLGGRAIREMKKNASGEYLIIAGPHDGSTGIAPKDFRFYTWTGNPTDAPILRSANLTALNANGSFESIVDLPSPLLSNSNLQVLVDNGDAVFYGDGTIAKELAQNNHKKFRSELINLGSAAIAIGTLSGTTFCENAPISVPFTTTETFNSGNIFTAQLSNASGSFANPVSIGTLTGTVAGMINATIPTGTVSGTGYRIRVVSSNLVIIGADNGTNLTINNCTPVTTIKSIITGNWESPSTWDLGRIPQAGDIVIIDQNHEVTLNGTGIAKKIQYQGTGKLKLSSASGILNTGL